MITNEILESRELGEYRIVTSNKQKLREYRRYAPNIKSIEGDDIDEVLADEITVILHKSKDNGPMTISEDTSLNIEGYDIGVNIKWMVEDLDKCEGLKAQWKVLLGKNDGKTIKIYEGVVDGVIGKRSENGIAFDSFLYINGSLLHDLKKDPNVNPATYSARAKATINLINDRFIYEYEISKIPKWEGEYQ